MQFSERCRRVAHPLLGLSAAGILVVVGLAAAVNGAGASRGTQRAVNLSVNRPDAEPAVVALEDAIAAAGAAAPDSYGGMRQAADGRLEVFVVEGRASTFLSHLPRPIAETEGARWFPIFVQHSYEALLRLTNSIASNVSQLRSEGILLGQWGPNPGDNRVVIHLQHYSSAAAARLIAIFGAQWVMVSTQPAALVPTSLDRFHDNAPFFGGDGIWRTGIDPVGRKYCGSGINIGPDPELRAWLLSPAPWILICFGSLLSRSRTALYRGDPACGRQKRPPYADARYILDADGRRRR